MTVSRKGTLLLIVAGLFSGAAQAQIQFGFKGGLNVAELLTSNNQFVSVNGSSEQVKNFPRSDFHAGLLMSMPLSKVWSFQPELTFSQQGATAKPSYIYSVSSSEEYRLSYINIPLLMKYRSPTGLFAETGPQVGLLVHAKIDETVVGLDNTENYNVKSDFKTVDVSWALGVGYLSPIDVGIDIRYNYGLTNINNASGATQQSYPVQAGHMRNSVFQVGLFFLLGKSGLQAPHKEGDL